jgi:hypothetical protein
MDISLSDADISKLLDDQCRIVLYGEISQYPTLEDLFGDFDLVVILYEFEPGSGHWTCLIRHEDGKPEYFDSTGGKPDDGLKFVPKSFRERSRQDRRYLTKLLYDYGDDVIYNEDELQEPKKSIATCGRWCVVRCWMRHMPIGKFQKLVKSAKNLDPDEVVYEATEPLLGK